MTRIADTLSCYKKNRNTGNLYEIAVALQLLRKMGMTNEELDADADLLEAIAVHNVGQTTELRELYLAIRTTSVGTGLVFDGKRILQIQCITQDDSARRTGDFLLHIEDGAVLSLSISEGKQKKNGEIKKCVSNPSAKRFGCVDDDMKKFKVIEQNAVPKYKAYMKEKYGIDETKWPHVATIADVDACTEVALAVAERFTSFSREIRTHIIDDFLCMEDGNKPADYLALVDKTNLVSQFFRFDRLTTDTAWEPTLVAKGVNLIFENAGKKICSTQVKFNNGVYRKGKTSSLRSSWNTTAFFTDLFNMVLVNV